MINTTLHSYWYDISNPEQKREYKALVAKLKATQGRGKIMRSWTTRGNGHYSAPLGARSITLKTTHLFDDQWTTSDGSRVFDWAEDASDRHPIGTMAPANVRRGHYLDITQEMVAIRANTFKCGYCGKQHNAPGFCDKCIDSEYLKASDLYLLRLLSVSDTSTRAPLSDSEASNLLQQYRQAQIHGATERGKARIAQERGKALAARDKALMMAQLEYDGKIWIMDNMPGMLANSIFYKHTGRFAFGWRRALDHDETGDLIERLHNGFPAPWDIESESRGKVSSDA